MRGTVKYYNRDRGYGFIAVRGEPDRYFHMSQLYGQDPPYVGNTVTFDPALRDGKPIAKHVEIIDRTARTKPRGVPKKGPYYGKPKYRKEWVSANNPPATKATGAGVLGGIGLLLGGPAGAIIGAVLGATIVDIERKEVEITSPCIRCGGTGQVTASVDGWTGFQCKKCRHFWRVKDEKL